jgi:hypothetical protein
MCMQWLEQMLNSASSINMSICRLNLADGYASIQEA